MNVNRFAESVSRGSRSFSVNLSRNGAMFSSRATDILNSLHLVRGAALLFPRRFGWPAPSALSPVGCPGCGLQFNQARQGNAGTLSKLFAQLHAQLCPPVP
jgi:hypothetical protein